ncbi:MAG TPA: hypothetical protein VNQ73_14825 [Ilumatobacter sp.]|nr:hypothetical protein [Ilumatobacter sp.]
MIEPPTSGRWMHLRGTVAELGAWHAEGIGSSGRVAVQPGAYRLGAPAVPILACHGRHSADPLGWVVDLWEADGHVWVEGLLGGHPLSEAYAFDVRRGSAAALSVGERDRRVSRGLVLSSTVREVSLVTSGADTTARVRESWWIDFTEGEHVAPAQLAIVDRVRRAVERLEAAAA